MTNIIDKHHGMITFMLNCVALLATATAIPSFYQTLPLYYERLGAPPPHGLLQSVQSQFHTQGELGQYSYGYNDGLSSKVESRTSDGITKGSYAFVDSNGVLQNVNYISDDVNGFRVSASNLPVPPVNPYPVPNAESVSNDSISTESETTTKSSDETTEEILTSENPLEKSNGTEQRSEIPAPSLVPNYAPAFPAIPVPAYPVYQNIVPAFYHAPLAPVYSQYHSQDQFGQYSYGYSGGPSSKSEVKTLDGITRGEYSYIDGNGIVQKVNYVADPVNGFRVAATNLPISPFYTQEYVPELNLISSIPDKTQESD